MTAATVHWFSEYNDGPACSRRRKGLTTRDPEAVTCRQSTCVVEARNARDRAARFARVHHPAVPGDGRRFTGTTPEGSPFASIEMDGRPWMTGLTWEDVTDLRHALGSVATTLYERDRDRIDAARMDAHIERMRREAEEMRAPREVPSE